MSKTLLKKLMITSFVACISNILLLENSFGMYRYGLTQEGADKEFGKKRAQGNNLSKIEDVSERQYREYLAEQKKEEAEQQKKNNNKK